MSCEHVYSFLMPQDSRHPDSLADKYFSIKSPEVASMSEGDKFRLKLIHHNAACCMHGYVKFITLPLQWETLTGRPGLSSRWEAESWCSRS